MAQTPPIANQSLLAFRNRLIGPQILNADGNYADSIIHAPLVDEKLDAASISDATPVVNLALFCSDALASVESYAATGGGIPILGAALDPAPTGIQQISIGTFDGTPSALALAASGDAGADDTFTVTNGVDPNPLTGIPGYAASFFLLLGPGETAECSIKAFSQSGVQHGWAYHEGTFVDADNNTIASTVRSVILEASAYTAAIRAAGNVIITQVAGTSYDVARVVGLWEQSAT
jgi:hypothetical protein